MAWDKQKNEYSPLSYHDTGRPNQKTWAQAWIVPPDAKIWWRDEVALRNSLWMVSQLSSSIPTEVTWHSISVPGLLIGDFLPSNFGNRRVPLQSAHVGTVQFTTNMMRMAKTRWQVPFSAADSSLPVEIFCCVRRQLQRNTLGFLWVSFIHVILLQVLSDLGCSRETKRILNW